MRIIPRKPPSNPNQASQNDSGIPDQLIPAALHEQEQALTPYLEKSEDIIRRRLNIGVNLQIPAQAVYLNNVVDTEMLNRHVLEPLMHYSGKNGDQNLASLVDLLAASSLSVGQIKTAETINEIVHHVFDGLVVILIDGCGQVLVVDIHGGEYRTVDEPPGERTARGPREGLVENLDINISMIRRRLRDPRLVVQKTMVGRRTRTPVAMMYIEDLASPEIVNNLRQRINAIDTDGIVASGYLEQFLEKSPWSIFPQIWSSERPDRLTMKLLEGRVVVIVHGTPLAFSVPTLALEYFQASEDYYERTIYSSMVRFTRFLAFFLAVSLPALYIALFAFQPELVPLKLLIPVAQARTQVPFPVVIETLIQEFIIQMVIESGLRLPGAIGQTIGVVAGIILGQAAISARLASPAIIIIIAIASIATFVMPSSGMLLASRVLRLPMILICATFGIYGFSLAWMLIVIQVSALEDFGAPYYAPFAPLRISDFKDSFFRTFLWKMKRRPVSYPVQDRVRQGETNRGEGGGS